MIDPPPATLNVVVDVAYSMSFAGAAGAACGTFLAAAALTADNGVELSNSESASGPEASLSYSSGTLHKKRKLTLDVPPSTGIVTLDRSPPSANPPQRCEP